jgi:hypothetical protein
VTTHAHTHTHTHTPHAHTHSRKITICKHADLLPAVVALVQVGSNAAELNQLVLLEGLRKLDVVEVVEVVQRVTEALVVTLLHQQAVECIVDRLLWLNGATKEILNMA